jgi:signal transduction histidine kinase
MLPSLTTHEHNKPALRVSSKNPALVKHHALRATSSSVQFSAALAHEIRNPITNINLSVDLLRAMLPDSTSKTYLDIIARGTIRINDLVTKLLHQKQESLVSEEGFFMHKILDEALQLAEDRIRLKQITVLKNYAQEDCRIILHRSKIKISLVNIILNAIDAMEAGKGRLKLSTRSTSDKYIIEVQDNGCGISKENLKHIFKPFYSSKPNGLGVGLSATYALLQSDHVDIAVKSTEGKGTFFILTFQRALAKSQV